MRVLVTGAGGLLGGRLAALLQERGFEVIATQRGAAPPPGPRAIPVDLAAPQAVERLLDLERPDAVVHSAALARADLCLREPARAEAVNARLPGTLAAACRARRTRLIALSTDLVFAGEHAPCREDDPTAPRSVYGRSKRAGEEAVLAACPDAAVARVALVCGRGHGPRATASEAVAWSLRAGQPVPLFTDEYRTPIDPVSLTDALERLLLRGGAGLFHLGGGERLTRHELGRRIARLLGLPEDGLVRQLRADHAGEERRPRDVSLDSSRARLELGWIARPLDEALRDGRVSPE